MCHVPAHKNVEHPAGQVSPVLADLHAKADAQAAAIADKPFDTVSFLMAYEDGGLDEDAIVEGFQHLIDSGLVWSLQGSYGRAAVALIDMGLCHPKGKS